MIKYTELVAILVSICSVVSSALYTYVYVRGPSLELAGGLKGGIIKGVRIGYRGSTMVGFARKAQRGSWLHEGAFARRGGGRRNHRRFQSSSTFS